MSGDSADPRDPPPAVTPDHVCGEHPAFVLNILHEATNIFVHKV